MTCYLTPLKVLSAYRAGTLGRGTEVHRPYGFLLGEKRNGTIVDVVLNTDGTFVEGLLVRWPDEAEPSFEYAFDLVLDNPDIVPGNFWEQLKAFFSRHQALLQL